MYKTQNWEWIYLEQKKISIFFPPKIWPLLSSTCSSWLTKEGLNVFWNYIFFHYFFQKSFKIYFLWFCKLFFFVVFMAPFQAPLELFKKKKKFRVKKNWLLTLQKFHSSICLIDVIFHKKYDLFLNKCLIFRKVIIIKELRILLYFFAILQDILLIWGSSSSFCGIPITYNG